METKYPKEISMRSGCKVSWLTYDNLSDAKKASEIAIQESYRLEALGDRKSTRLNSSHSQQSRMPSSA